MQPGDAALSNQKLPRVASRGEFVRILYAHKDRLGVKGLLSDREVSVQCSLPVPAWPRCVLLERQKERYFRRSPRKNLAIRFSGKIAVG